MRTRLGVGQNIMRDLKRHTSEVLHKAIQNNNAESRKEWMLWMMERAAKKNSNSAKFQLWQPESHPVQLLNNKIHINSLSICIIILWKPGLLQKQKNGNTAVQ